MDGRSSRLYCGRRAGSGAEDAWEVFRSAGVTTGRRQSKPLTLSPEYRGSDYFNKGRFRLFSGCRGKI
ncbi:hypothetical protein SBA3_2230001 [Candidatus Sulfopaludibacter sp. SbA3]|nr:hypothetical protein SBA3_2230001 [Candidatus Sulfopaludibacter sp. SbA3]